MTSLFTDQVPTFANESDGTPGITTGTTLTFSEEGFVTHIRFRATTTVGGSDTYVGRLYQVTGPDDFPGNGSVLGEVSFSSAIVAAGQWNAIALPSKVAVTPGLGYRTTMFTGSSGRYVAKTNFFNTGTPVVNGPVAAPEHASNPFGFGVFRQGVYIIDDEPAYPHQESNAASYFVDVVFEVKKHSKGAELLAFF